MAGADGAVPPGKPGGSAWPPPSSPARRVRCSPPTMATTRSCSAWLDPAVHPVWKQQLAAGPRRPSRRRRGSVGAWPRCTRAFVPHRGGFATARAAVRRPAAPAIPARHRRATTRSSRRSCSIWPRHWQTQRHHGHPWRRQPEEHPRRPERPRAARRRVRRPRRPGVRPRLLRQPLAVEGGAPAGRRDELLARGDELILRYLDGSTWEPAGDSSAVHGALVPALALARVDGLSPVEYLSELGRSTVRRTADRQFDRPADSIATS